MCFKPKVTKKRNKQEIEITNCELNNDPKKAGTEKLKITQIKSPTRFGGDFGATSWPTGSPCWPFYLYQFEFFTSGSLQVTIMYVRELQRHIHIAFLISPFP